MSKNLSGGGNVPPGGAVALRLLRVAKETTVRVRSLSEVIHGLITHYGRNGSEACQGEDVCPPGLHRFKIWKGYTPVEWWEPRSGCWIPAVLEVTERLEQDFRSKWSRGQVWKLSRGPDTKKKRSPVIGELVENLDPRSLRDPFPILPPLFSIYRLLELPESVPNPLPGRILIQPSSGLAPADLVAAQVVNQEQPREVPTLKLKEAFEAIGRMPSRNAGS